MYKAAPVAAPRSVIDIVDYLPDALRADAQAGIGTSDLRPFIQRACDVARERGGAEIRFPNGKFAVQREVSVHSGIRIVGAGDKTIFAIKNNHILFWLSNPVSRNIAFGSFHVVCEDRPGALSDQGLIHSDNMTGLLDGLLVENILFDTAANGRNHVFVKARPSSPCRNIKHHNNRHLAAGRMNFEIIQHENDDPSFVTGLEIGGNFFSNAGRIGIDIQCSLSGAMDMPVVCGNEFSGSINHQYGYGLELAGGLSRALAIANHFHGHFHHIVSNSSSASAAAARHLRFTQNRSDAGTIGRFMFAASVDGAIIDNDLQADATNEPNKTLLTFAAAEARGEKTTRNHITGNRLRTRAPIVVQFDGSGANVLENNPLISNEDCPNPRFVVLALRDTAKGNIIRSNRLRTRKSGQFDGEMATAAGNRFSGNIHDNGP